MKNRYYPKTKIEQKKRKMKPIRQGDVYLKPCSAIPAGSKKIAPVKGRIVLAEGKATGHAHTMTAECTTLFGVDESMVVVVDKPTTLDHQEHGKIEVAPGAYWVVRQREYTPKAIRRVLD